MWLESQPPDAPARLTGWHAAWHAVVWSGRTWQSGSSRQVAAGSRTPISWAAHMTLAVGLFGLFVASLGIAGAVSPERLLAEVTRSQARLGTHGLAALRLFIGGALLLAAPPSRAPVYLKALGGLSLISGTLTLLVGTRRLEAILDWWRARPAWAVRLWSAFVVLFGASMVWAVLPLARAG
jgi:hypothetical protein